MLHGYKRSHLLAVYRDYGRDQTAETGDDYLTFKVLNRVGRTVSAYTTDASETRVLGSSAASYTSSGSRKANNLLAASAYTAQPGVKLMRNGGAEYSGNYWNSAATVANVAYHGEHSFQINGNELYQLFRLYPGKTYTFSGYIKINGTTASNGGVALAFQESISTTEVRDIMNSPYLQTTTSAIDDGWQRVSLTYAPPREIVVRTAVLSKNLGSATAYGDCFQLEESESASSYNLLNCGSFEESDSIKPYKANEKVCGWYYTGNVSLQSSTNVGILFGAQMLQVNGGSGAQRASQELVVNAPAGSTFLLSGWGKADALPGSVAALTPETKDYPYYGLIARLYYEDGASDPFYFPFDPYFSGWQERSGILMPSEANQNKAITSVTVVASYDNNANVARFDNISLRLEPSQTYRYDENGNPIAATQQGAGTENATYASNGIDLTSYTAANGAKYTYTYNSAHDVTTAKLGGLTATTTYNASGNVTGSKLTASGTSLYMEASASATPDRNHTETVTDASGHTTTYAYSGNGQLLSVTDAKGRTTEYVYDATLRPWRTYRTGIANIDYTYTNGRLTTLDRKTFREEATQHQYYNFAYNEWGQPTTTKVGDCTLSTNIYYKYNNNPDETGAGGNLKTTTYGNEDSVTYTYDELDRLTGKVYTDGRYVTYTYNAEGQLAELTYGDGSSKVASYLFEYDSLGRLVRSSEANGSGTVTQRTEHIYDEHNRLKRQGWTVNNQSYSEAYTYNDGEDQTGNLNTMTNGTGNVLNYTYDPLKRLQKVTVKDGNTSLFSTAYAYHDIDSTRTTPQVEFRNVRIGDSGTILEGKKYVYDELGNITEIRQSTSPYNLLIAYEYDSQNQLTSEIHYDGNGEATANITVAYYYNYDTAGNLLKVEKGTVSSAGTLTKTTEQTYTYGDGDWHDLLTAVNGNTITYDASGNPLHYGNWTFDWQRGRELASAEQTDGTTKTTLTYAYDADGIRTSKTYKVETYETRYTVTFVADGTTVKTMTVADGYTLKDSDYPTVPAKSGYSGTWQKYTAAIHSNITVQATYTALAQYTVKFVADGVTVKTMTVYDGYVLKASDYPAIPEKEGYLGQWQKYGAAIHADITITATYRELPIIVSFVADGKTVKWIRVADGTVLEDSDYPAVPEKSGYVGYWEKYTEPLHNSVSIQAVYISASTRYIVSFSAGGVRPVKTMRVQAGYVLADSDYPDVPEKSGYTGRWEKYTEPIFQHVSINAIYTKRDGEVMSASEGQLADPAEDNALDEAEANFDGSAESAITKPADAETTAENAEAANNGDNSAQSTANHSYQDLLSTQTVTHEYLTLSGKVVRETVKTNNSITYVLDFLYDESGRPFALNYSTNDSSFTTYYYILNLQGDVVKLVTSSGSAVATYEYDAWGNILSKSGTMADKNPLRYRGYYYDTETGYYYLQSRYYDPTVRRFINADSYTSTGQGFVGTNMFAYCNNSPIIFSDPQGYSLRPSTVAINDGGSNSTEPITVTRIVAYINYNAADGPEIVAASPGAASSHSTGGIPPVGLNASSAIGDPLYMIGTYRELRLITVGTGYEVHHLIEKRFLSILQDYGAPFKSHRDMPSVVLTKSEHRGYTNAWRAQFAYGGDSPDYEAIKKFYTSEYAGNGDWLELLAYYLN